MPLYSRLVQTSFLVAAWAPAARAAPYFRKVGEDVARAEELPRHDVVRRIAAHAPDGVLIGIQIIATVILGARLLARRRSEQRREKTTTRAARAGAHG